MATAQPDILLRYIRKLRAAYTSEQLSDRELLRRFAESKDQAAFEILIHRHGPMVLRLCRRILPQVQDAEDVFQATFFVLARQAASRHWQESVGNWLYGVAYRLAQGAKREAARRSRHECRVGHQTTPDPVSEITLREPLLQLDEELNHLPEKHRAAMVLCYLEGKTRDEAAKQLGWSLGTLKRRLEEGRKHMHDRLVRRGVTFTSALAAASLAQGEGPGTALMKSALTAAKASATQKAATGIVSKKVAALAERALRTMLLTKLKMAVAMLLAAGVLTAGSGLLTWRGRSEPQPSLAGQGAQPSQKETDLQPAKDLLGDDLPLGALARMGTVRLHHGGPALSVAFSTDGKWIVSSGGDFQFGHCDFTASIWDAATGKELRRFSGHWGRIFAVAISPDGKTIATGSEDRTICLWDAATAQELHRLQGHRGKINGVAFSPDGKMLASASDDGSIRLWDVATGREMHLLLGHRQGVQTVLFMFMPAEQAVRSVAFSPAGKTLVSASVDGTLRLWEAATGKELRHIGQQQQSINGLALTADGHTLASGGGDGVLRAWDLDSGKLLHALHGHEGEILAVAISPDGRTLASSSQDRTLRLWDLGTQQERKRLIANQEPVASVAFSPDGKTLASASWGHSVRLCDVATGEERLPLPSHHGYVGAVVFAADGQTLATYGADQTIRFWDAKTGILRRHFFGGQARGKAVAFARDGKSVALGDSQGRIHLLDASSGREIQQFGQHGKAIILVPWKPQNERTVMSVAYSPDGKQLASCGIDGTVCVWETATGKSLHEFKGHKAEVTSVAFSPDGTLVVSGSEDGTPRLWVLSTGTELHTLRSYYPRENETVEGFPGGIETMAFSPDGRLLATGTVEPALRLWDVASGKLIHRFDASTAGSFIAVAFSPDGRMLAANNPRAPSILLWEVATWQERRRLFGDRGGVVSLCFSPDGRRLASGSKDGTALVWDVSGPTQRAQLGSARLRTDELESLWAGLGASDAAKAYEALCTLFASPGQAVPFLRKQLQPAAAVEGQRIAQLIRELDDETFAVREKARMKLEKLGDLAEPALRTVLAKKPSLEVRLRGERLLERLQVKTLSEESLQAMRAIELLERIGTPEARQVLEGLAKGEPGARLTDEAQASLQRLAR
jgi:RNA polymerase sigma factor (sigma-70 family)